MATPTTHTARQITSADLLAIARVHMLAFPNSALTSLGPEAVRRYYHWQLTGPHDGVALCIAEGGELTAFCFGGIYRGALGGFLRNNRRYLIWCLATRPWILANKVIRQQIGAAIRSLGSQYSLRSRTTPVPAPMPRKASFGILSIAVHPRKGGTGQGHYLMSVLEREAKEREFAGMQLTVSPKNHHAIRFYERLGWSRKLEPSGIWSGAMRKDFLQ